MSCGNKCTHLKSGNFVLVVVVEKLPRTHLPRVGQT